MSYVPPNGWRYLSAAHYVHDETGVEAVKRFQKRWMILFPTRFGTEFWHAGPSTLRDAIAIALPVLNVQRRAIAAAHEEATEYDAYRTELRAELAKWSTGEPPYEFARDWAES